MPLWPQEERVHSPSLHSPGLPDCNSELAGAQAPPRCAVAQPHVPAPRLLTPLFHPSAPQGAQQELLSTTPMVRTFLGEEESCSPQDVTSQARKCVNLLSYKQ